MPRCRAGIPEDHHNLDLATTFPYLGSELRKQTEVGGLARASTAGLFLSGHAVPPLSTKPQC